MAIATETYEADDTAELTNRQKQVLGSVLELLVEEGDAFSMAAVAKRANCSKESLYKWFGDREGLLTATVRWRASEVRADGDGGDRLDETALRLSLTNFAVNWLRVISTETSLALNRIAIAHAGSGKSNLGQIVLANGRFAIARRLKPVLEAARTKGLLSFNDTESAFRIFFGLVARDVQIRLLLGDKLAMSDADILRDADTAAHDFMALFGGKNGKRPD